MALHHKALGATLDNNGVPVYYTNSNEEYLAVRRSAGFADISHIGRLSITGKDRIPFLNGLLSNDITKTRENAGLHSVLLNTRARVLADLYLYAETDRIVMDTGDRSSSDVKRILDQFIITEAVDIKDISEERVLLTVQGPGSREAIKQVLKLDVDDLVPLQSRSLGPSLVMSRDRTGQGGFDILVPTDEAESVWQGFLLKGGDDLLPVGLEALEILRLEAGLPRYGIDVDENTIVLEAGYKDAISFTKGCYMGQEVVARATHIGRVNRRLAQLRVESKQSLQAGAVITSKGESVGSITSSAFSPGEGKIVAMSYVGRDFASVGQELVITDAGKELPAVVSKII